MYTFYFALSLMLFVISLHCSSGEDLKEMMENVINKCREKYDMEITEIETAIKDKKLPDSDKGKDFLGCIIKEVGLQQLRRMATEE